MNKSCQITCNAQGLPFMGNPKHVVIHNLDRTMANYNQSGFNMVKNDVKQYVIQNNKLETVRQQLESF